MLRSGRETHSFSQFSFPSLSLSFSVIVCRLSSIASLRLLASAQSSMSIPNDHRNSIRHILQCFYLLSCLLHATAQSYTTLDEKQFYFMPDWASPEFFSLDLTRSWNATEAPLQLLPALPLPLLPGGRPDLPFMQISPLVVNKDKKSLIYFDSNRTPSLYNISTTTWQLGTLLTARNSTELQRSVYSNQVAIDPSTGIAYIPSLENLPSVTNPDNTFSIYTYRTFQGHTTNVKKTVSVPGFFFPYTTLSAVWSTVRKCVLFYGSAQEIAGEIIDYTALMEYHPSTNNWTVLKTQGDPAPGATRDACMASAYNGTKIVMFGTLAAPYSVFILNPKTLVWTKGADPKPGQERNGAVCTVVGDNFIVAGGTLIENKQRVLVYNIKLDQWTDIYEPPHTPTKRPGGETASPVAEPGSSSGERMSSGAKIGIIGGGLSTLVVLLICGFLLIRWRKMRRSSQTDDVDKVLPKFSLAHTEKDKVNRNYPSFPGKVLDSYSLSGFDRGTEVGEYDSNGYAYRAPPPLPLRGSNASPTNTALSPMRVSSSPSLPNPTTRQYENTTSPHLNKATLRLSEYRQQHPAVVHTVLREVPSPTPDDYLKIHGARGPQDYSSASSPTLDGLLKPQAERNPQHISSSIPTVAVQQWQCAQPGHNPQYIPSPRSISTTPTLKQSSRDDIQDDHGGHHDSLDHRAIYHDQRRDDPQNDRDHHNHTADYNATHHDRYSFDLQASYGDTKGEEYLVTYQGPRMNAPQEHGRSSTEKDISCSNVQRRPDPQDHTRHSAASRLEFYQTQPLNNPQDHGHQDDQDGDILNQEIQRIRAQQEEHRRQRQNLERVLLEKEAKLYTLAGRTKYPLERRQY